MKTLTFPLSVLSLALTASYANAAATLVSEMSHLNVGTAGAGSAVVSEFASTAYSNPAAMVELKQRAVSVNLAAMALNVTYEDERNSALSSGNAGGVQPYGSSYYVEPLSERLALGVALTATGGSALDYGSDYAGALELNDLALTVLQLNPSLGYKLNEKINIGGGLQIDYAKFNQSLLLNRAELETDSVALGFNVGATYEMDANNRFGITYRSKMDHDLGGTLTVGQKQLDADVSLINAARVELSGLHQVTEPLGLLWSLGQEYWSANDSTIIDINSSSINKARGFDDVWFASAGARYQVSPKLRIESGIGFVSSPLNDPSMQSADLPVDEQRKYSVGLSYSWSKATTINAYYSYVDYGNPEISTATMQGSFDNHNQFAGIELNYQFH